MEIETILVATSPFTHLVFYFDEKNYFHRGSLGYLPHALSLIFMVFMFYSSFVNHKKVDLLEIGLIVYIEIVCISAMIFETVFGYSFLLITAMTFSIILYYVFLNTQLNKRDALTGVLNRRCFYLETEHYKNTTMAIILCDMNCLKKINDGQGHNAGDKAICAMSDAICNATVNGFKVYRVGGDEFAVIGRQKTEQEATAYIDKAKELLKKTPYQVSFGYAIYHPGDDFDKIYHISDAKMYEDKRVAKESIK